MKILNNLFSIFDPSCYSASSSWMMLYIPLVMTILMLTTKLSFMKKLILLHASKEFTLRPNKDKPINLVFFLIIFTTVLMYNIMGLVAFSFTITAQIAVTFSVSTITLVSIWTYDWSFSLIKYFAHLCTKGGPLWLAMLIVLIEFISMMIRPITLSIRLTANMMAGHLLMSLLFGMISWLGLPLLLPVAMALFILELAVSAIQAYVITMLISEYYSEVYSTYKLISN